MNASEMTKDAIVVVDGEDVAAWWLSMRRDTMLRWIDAR
jgi:hypothetical protein